ncbi:MAG: acyl-homoserine-lactone synthase [Pseudomonadota bacterium]
MLRYVYGHDLSQFPTLAHTMFTDRAEQFRHRLGWDVTVDDAGHETDEYDALDPLYIIWEAPDGSHGGSMRFLPTVGRTMINEHFSHLTDGVHIESPLIWECTRFCLSPRATGGQARKTAGALVLGAGEMMERAALEHYVGVFDARMERIYRHYGVEPEVIGSEGEGRARIGVGLWRMRPEAWEPTLARLGIDRDTSRRWVAQSLGAGRHGFGGASAPMAASA